MSEFRHGKLGGRHSNHRSRNKRQSSVYPFIVGGMALLAAYAVVNPDRLPAPIKTAAGLYRNVGREHAPPPGAYYSNCAEARAAGVAPIYQGEPGYREELDGDDDGIACEPYRAR